MERTLSITTAAFIAMAATAAILMTGCTSSGHNDHDAATQKNQKTVRYTCSMHPEVVQDKPGDCPKCGMKLEEKH
jgi:hypothetical protein